MTTLAPDAVTRLSLAEKVGQMIIGGWPDPSVTPDVRRLITEHRVGGLSLLPRNLRNAGQTAALCHELQMIAAAAGQPAPLWLAADQEGGAILAVRDGVTPFPGNLALGATGDPHLAYQVGLALASELKALGINLNYAPVLDVATNPRNPIIGVRSFGGDPKRVAAFGRAFVQGALAAGALAVGKHFPGHGDTNVDSHLALPRVDRSLAELNQVELVPFRAAIEAGLPAVMSAHILFPALDPAFPATLSPRILTGLLRETLRFDGLILTDCLEMAAVAGRWPDGELAVRAVEAGADLLLLSHSFERQVAAVDAMVAAVVNGRLSETRVDESVRRILAAKRLFIHPSAGQLGEEWGALCAAHARLEAEVCAAAITLVCDGGFLPLAPGSPVTAVWPRVSPRARTSDPEEICPLGAALARHSAGVRTVQFSPQPDAAELARVVEAVAAGTPAGQVLVIGTATARPEESEAQGRLVRTLLALGHPTVVVALRNPQDLGNLPGTPAALASYSYHPAAVAALAGVLFGERSASGVLPVSL